MFGRAPARPGAAPGVDRSQRPASCGLAPPGRFRPGSPRHPSRMALPRALKLACGVRTLGAPAGSVKGGYPRIRPRSARRPVDNRSAGRPWCHGPAGRACGARHPRPRPRTCRPRRARRRIRTQPCTWSSRIMIETASTAARSAAVCWRMSTQYSSRSIMRAIPRTWPSIRLRRRTSWALSLL